VTKSTWLSGKICWVIETYALRVWCLKEWRN